MKRVEQEMTKRVAFVFETDTIDEAFRSMKTLGVRHAPVVRDGFLVGILSDRDILLHAKPDKGDRIHVPSKAVSQVMTKEVFCCRMNDSIGTVADLMIEKKISAVPVIDENEKLIGIITSEDLIRLLRSQTWEFKMPLPFKFESHSLLAANVN